jgi:hypothetical protein
MGAARIPTPRSGQKDPAEKIGSGGKGGCYITSFEYLRESDVRFEKALVYDVRAEV